MGTDDGCPVAAVCVVLSALGHGAMNAVVSPQALNVVLVRSC